MQDIDLQARLRQLAGLKDQIGGLGCALAPDCTDQFNKVSLTKPAVVFICWKRANVEKRKQKRTFKSEGQNKSKRITIEGVKGAQSCIHRKISASPPRGGRGR